MTTVFLVSYMGDLGVETHLAFSTIESARDKAIEIWRNRYAPSVYTTLMKLNHLVDEDDTNAFLVDISESNINASVRIEEIEVK